MNGLDMVGAELVNIVLKTELSNSEQRSQQPDGCWCDLIESVCENEECLSWNDIVKGDKNESY